MPSQIVWPLGSGMDRHSFTFLPDGCREVRSPPGQRGIPHCQGWLRVGWCGRAEVEGSSGTGRLGEAPYKAGGRLLWRAQPEHARLACQLLVAHRGHRGRRWAFLRSIEAVGPGSALHEIIVDAVVRMRLGAGARRQVGRCTPWSRRRPAGRRTHADSN